MVLSDAVSTNVGCFEKAFDSLEWHFLLKCLELFNFGPDLIRWVNTFYKNVKSCIINNGHALSLNVMKTEATWIASLQNCVHEPFGFKWKTCVKFLGIFITYDVKILVQKNFKQRLKKIANLINLWKFKRSINSWQSEHYQSNTSSQMIYPSSFLSMPATVIKEFNALVFNFLWNGKDKVTRCSTYAPYDFGGLKMIGYETIVRALRLRCLKRIVNVECCGFWKHYLYYLLSNKGGLFFVECNYDIKQTNILPIFYHELLSWWAELRLLIVENC